MSPIHMISIAAVIGVTGAIAYEMMNSETTGLENAHTAAGMTANCQALDEPHQAWTLCDTGRSAASAWLHQDGRWLAGNGQAQKVLDRLEKNGAGAYQNLPILAREPGVFMPDAVRDRLQ